MNKTRKGIKHKIMDNNKQSKKSLHVFTKKHYKSGDGMLTYVWGPPMWHFLHTMSFNYPVSPTAQQKRQYRAFILSLQYVLPCGKCRLNLTKNLKKMPLTMKELENRHTFSLYMYRLHELVNKMLNKKSGLSYEDVRERYEHFRARCLQPSSAVEVNGEQNKKVDEKGCTEPLYGTKSKCLLKIVPLDTKCNTMEIDNQCMKYKA